MPTVIAAHAVGNMQTWLAGGAERVEIFKQFCSGYHVCRNLKESRVAVVWENVDMKKLEAALNDPNVEKAKARHTVIDPIELFVEVEGAR
jgi:hypothetical protein